MKLTGRLLIPCAMAAAGLFASLGPTLVSGLARIQTDKGDTRLVNYFLEHAYLWAADRAPHTDLWSPPYFYPERNTAAYSDPMLGAVPFYVPWRLIGFLPDTSLQLWMLTVSLLNFAAFFLLSRQIGFGTTASSFGSFLFSFASMRNAQIGHQHLIPHFFTVAAVAACIGLFREAEASRRAVRIWIGVFFAALVAQIYAGFYLAWFLALGLTLAFVWALVFEETRRRLLALLRGYPVTILVATAASVVAVWPLMTHYLEASRTVGLRDLDTARSMLASPLAWLDMGPKSWLYGWTSGLGWFRGLEPFEWEKRLGIGLVTPLAACWGLWSNRTSVGVRLLIAVTLSILLLSTVFPGGRTLWGLVFAVFPAAKAIRAVSRVGFLLLIPASLGLSLAVEGASRAARARVLLPLGLLVVLEQGQTTPSYDKREARDRVAAIARTMPSSCEAFFFSPVRTRGLFWETQVDALWVEMATRVPTINGYSSSLPPKWSPLLDHAIQSERPTDEARLNRALGDWVDSHGLDRGRVCWLQVPDDEP